MANIFYGYTAIQTGKVPFEDSECFNLKRIFKKPSKMAERDCLKAVMIRITTFNKTEVQLFFKLLEEMIEKH